jgi:hypothetical protein
MLGTEGENEKFPSSWKISSASASGGVKTGKTLSIIAIEVNRNPTK